MGAYAYARSHVDSTWPDQFNFAFARPDIIWSYIPACIIEYMYSYCHYPSCTTLVHAKTTSVTSYIITLTLVIISGHDGLRTCALAGRVHSEELVVSVHAREGLDWRVNYAACGTVFIPTLRLKQVKYGKPRPFTPSCGRHFAAHLIIVRDQTMDNIICVLYYPWSHRLKQSLGQRCGPDKARTVACPNKKFTIHKRKNYRLN